MMRSKPGLKHISFAVACAAGAMLLGHFAATELIESQRARHLSELNEIALRRAETVVDYGRANLDEMAKYVSGDCDSSALQTLRLQVYQRSTVKDVRLIDRDGSVKCSAFSETLEFDKGWVTRSDMLPSGDGRTLLFRVEQFSGTALGIVKDLNERTSLVSIISLNSYVFDLMPGELRDRGTVVLNLKNGQMVAGSPRRDAEKPLVEPRIFTSVSSRYPLQTEVKVEAAALAEWNTEQYWPIVAFAAGLGLIFGGLLAAIIFRPVSPIVTLDRALAARAFKPFFLPTFSLRGGEIVGCEVLARWFKPDGTIVPPLSFIPLAESSGRIEALTWRIMEQGLDDLQPVLARDRAFVVSFNIMPGHMISVGFVAQMRAMAISRRVSPRQISLEVTERNAFPDLQKAAAVVAELRDRGFSVALDDVGIGHNGLSQIQALGANVLKIDKFFVDSISRSSTGQATVEMLVRLASELKMTVVAEGIETEEQRNKLIECGVGEGQGYLVSPPLPAAKFLALLGEHRAASTQSESIPPVAAQVA
jgi:sensor c-di-GMP phosphodiesterase-like protein